ncbi:MAG: GGDEF domain-containing protein [Catenulispora sp.]|nr:GGDEF domain-containing protein [Catenulispora sp.]
MVMTDTVWTPRLPGRSQVLRELLGQGRSREVIALAGQVMARGTDPEEKAVASTQELAAYFNIGQAGSAKCRASQEQAHELARVVGSPTALGHFHALAAGLASARGSADEALAHLLDSQRHLNAEQDGDVTTVTEVALYDLATTQGNLGLGDNAMASLRRLVGLSGRSRAWLAPRLDAALALDHIGDTRGAVEALDEVVRQGRTHQAADSGGLQHWDAVSYAYASARLMVLDTERDTDFDSGFETGRGVDPRQLWHAADDAIAPAFALLIRACVAIAAHRPVQALAFLDRIGADCPLPPAELLRVRSLALSASGDSAGAVELERESFRIQSQRMYQLQRLMLTQPASQATDGWELSTYVREALTDPLTGLPNRRHLERRLSELTTEGRTTAALAVLDLDGFKQVNTVHGHIAGDRVLARIAAILADTLRTGDFVARYGGDEFVLLLPETSQTEARAIGRRINAAIASADWHTIAPRTPIGASIGWTRLGDHSTPEAAIQAADQAMYAVKR